MPILRAVRARLGQSLALFATGVVVVAGCLVAVGYSRATSGTVGSAAALLLLGVVALATQAAASARARRYEMALAQLRGRTGLRLLRLTVTEPIAILGAAAVAGTCAGWVLATAAVQRWAGVAASFEMTRVEWLAVTAVLAVSVVVVVVVTWRTTYEPLTGKLGQVERPRRATATAAFLSLLVLIGAAVSVYQARELGVRHANWVSFVSPALLGLAAGQVGVWLVALLARLGMGWPVLSRRIGWFVTLRRLSRTSDSAAVIRIVVAAVAVAGVAGSAWVGAGSWRDSTARMQSGGPVTYAVPDGALQAYAASHAADPQGRWLMAMSATPDTSGGSRRDVFVDVPRWERTVGSFYGGTPLDAVTARIGALAPQREPPLGRGSTFDATFDAASVKRSLLTNRRVRHMRRYGPLGNSNFVPLAFLITYVDSHGDTQMLNASTGGSGDLTPRKPGVVGLSTSIRVDGTHALACTRACSVVSVDVQGLTTEGTLLLKTLTFAGQRLVPAADAGMLVQDTRAVGAASTPGGLALELRDPYTPHPLVEWPNRALSPALTTPGVKLEKSHGKPVAYGPDGDPRPVRISGEVPALPLIGRSGLLLDLGTALRGAGGQIPGTQTLVVARADTPDTVLGALQATGAVGKRHAFEEDLTRIRRSGTAQGTLLYTLIAVFGLLIAALSVVSAVADQRRGRRREAASLRVLGVDSGAVARGYRGEAEALGIAVAVIAGIAVWVACWALLGVLPLVNPGEFGLLFDATPDVRVIAGIAVAAGVVVALVVFLSFRLVGRSSPPRLLREEA